MDRHFWIDTLRDRRVELVQHDLSENVPSYPADDFSRRHLDDRRWVRFAANGSAVDALTGPGRPKITTSF